MFVGEVEGNKIGRLALEVMSNFQEKCNQILDNDSLFEEDKIDLLEEIVLQKYKCSVKEAEKIILDILWKHKDPSKKQQKAIITGVQDIEIKIDIPSLERRLELEKQVRDLEVLNEKTKQNKSRTSAESVKIENEYQELLAKTQSLRQELYKGKIQSPTITSSPIDHLNDMFNGSLPRHRIEQALKSNGYDIIEAATHLMNQLKASQEQNRKLTQPLSSEPFFSVDKKNKALCSFFIKNGSCLRADCKFSHDVETRVCSFWLKGNCLAGDKCLFKHDINLANTELKNSPLTPPTTAANLNSTKIESSPSCGNSFKTASVGSIQSFVPSKALKIVKPIKKPKFIPWESQSESEYFKSYVNNRNSANRNEAQRKKYAKMSTDSWKTNNAGKAKQLSDKANKYEEAQIEALKLADDDLCNYSETTEGEIWFEMHGLEFNEAIEQLSSSLSDLTQKERANSKMAYLVVPSTNNTIGYKKTTKPITIWLDHMGYKWLLFGCGNGIYGSLIGIDPWSIYT